MTRSRRWRGIAVITSLISALFVFGVPKASAHEHPPTKDLTGPGVVYIESGYHVEIALIEHSLTAAHILVVQRSYNRVLVHGSGFVVDPSAVIVTSGAVVSPDRQMATNFAVNSIFRERYRNVALPADFLAQEHLGQVPDDYSPENRLRACYLNRTNASAGGCVIKLTRVVTVYPYVTRQDKYGTLTATVLTPAEGTSADIAILRVSAGSMPTVKLVDSNAKTYHLGVLGFDGIPGTAHPVLAYKAHMDKVGGTKFKAAVDDNKVFSLVTPQVLSSGLQGGPVAAELGQVVGFISAPTGVSGRAGVGPPVLVRTSAVVAALAKQKVTPAQQSGPADVNYQSAIHKFQNNGFAASIPGFQNALSAYPGHFLAAQNLAVAQAKVKAGQGGPDQVTPQAATVSTPGSTGVPWWVWVAIGAAVLLAALGAAYLIKGRRTPKPTLNASATASTRPSRAGGPGAGVAPARRPAQAGPVPSWPAQQEPVVEGARAASNRLGSTPPISAPASASRPSAAGLRTEPNPRGEAARGPQTVEGGRGANTAPSAPPFCTRCGERLASHHPFCGWCGGPVG